MIAAGKPLNEVIEKTKKFIEPIANSDLVQSEEIMDSPTAREKKKDIRRQRKQGKLTVSGSVKRMIKANTITYEFE